MSSKISIVAASNYSSSGVGRKYMPMIIALGERIECCYGIGFPRGYVCQDEPVDKMRLTKIPSRISLLVGIGARVFKYPKYFQYWKNVMLFDKMIAQKISKDHSKVVFLNPQLFRSAEAAKKSGKIVIVEAGNSEPNREHERIKTEYELFDINHKYIYGDEQFKDACLRSFAVADYIITISKVSNQTYLDAGYPISKLKMIPLTGTDFPLTNEEIDYNKTPAFISTAFHNFIKGTHRLLLAWKKANIKNVPLIIVGKVCEDLQEFIDKTGPYDNVIFMGHNSNLKEWYKQYNAVGVLMSLSEGAGRTTPEMMSFGFPMIVSPDATCDLVQDGKNGFIIESTDEEALAERFKWFANDWNRALLMKQNVLTTVEHRTMRDFSLELGEFLKSICDE